MLVRLGEAVDGKSRPDREWFNDSKPYERGDRVRADRPPVPFLRLLLAYYEDMEHTCSVMTDGSHTETLLQLVKEKGLVRSSDLDSAGIPRVYLTRLTVAGRLERAGRGLYRIPGSTLSEHETLAFVATRVPQAVFCLLTALHVHELTTERPGEVWIAMPRGSHAPRLGSPPIRMIQFSGAGFNEGIERLPCEQIELRVYGVAKTVADCFKHRKKIGLDVAIDALKDALVRKRVTQDELWSYARLSRVESVMRPYIEAMA